LSQEQNTGNERGAKGSPIGEERQFHYGKDYAGEVGLIFAGIGAKLVLDGHPVIDAGKYSAVVIMVVVTTLVTPPLLKQVLSKKDSCELTVCNNEAARLNKHSGN